MPFIGDNLRSLNFSPYYRYYGLFGTANNAIIKNIGITNFSTVNIFQSASAGGICGYAWNCDISNCYASGSYLIENKSNQNQPGAGGVLGFLYQGSIINCYSECDI